MRAAPAPPAPPACCGTLAQPLSQRAEPAAQRATTRAHGPAANQPCWHRTTRTNPAPQEGENTGVALRGLFIIGPDGRLRQKTVNDLPVGRSGARPARPARVLPLAGGCARVGRCCSAWGLLPHTLVAAAVTHPHTPTHRDGAMLNLHAVDETLRLLKAFQFTDEHGEVGGWVDEWAVVWGAPAPAARAHTLLSWR